MCAVSDKPGTRTSSRHREAERHPSANALDQPIFSSILSNSPAFEGTKEMHGHLESHAYRDPMPFHTLGIFSFESACTIHAFHKMFIKQACVTLICLDVIRCSDVIRERGVATIMSMETSNYCHFK